MVFRSVNTTSSLNNSVYRAAFRKVVPFHTINAYSSCIKYFKTKQNDIGDIIYAETESTWSVKNTVHMSITLFINDVMGGDTESDSEPSRNCVIFQFSK